MAAGWSASHDGPRDPPRNGEKRHADRVGARFADLTKVADAILYEGYLLYPYRRSSTKIRGSRWQFGILSPRRTAISDDDRVDGSVESCYQQTQCLIERPRGDLAVQVRFLQLRHKTIRKLRRGGGSDVVRELEVDGVLHIGFAEAIPRTYELIVDAGELAAAPLRRELCYPACETSEPILDSKGNAVGLINRRIMPLCARFYLELSAARAVFPLRRLTIRAENAARAHRHNGSREDTLARSLISTHTLIGIDDGVFLSQLDPPQWARDAVKECRNIHTFPVLTGNPGAQDRMISSPIILNDYPQVAPESPGDLFDATEIDEILSLRTTTMAADEKREAQETNSPSAAVVDRVESMPPKDLAKLRGRSDR